MPKDYKKIAITLHETLVLAQEHLEYCGYGDTWERECAAYNGLSGKIQEALKLMGGK